MYVERNSFKNYCVSGSCASHSLDTDTISTLLSVQMEMMYVEVT